MFNRLTTWWENWNENYKKAILTLLFSIIAVLLAYVTYYVFFRPIPQTRKQIIPKPLPVGTLPVTDIRDILDKRGIPTEAPAAPTPPTLPPTLIKPSAVAKGGRTIATPRLYTNARNVEKSPDGTINFYNSSDGKFYSIDKSGAFHPLSDEVFPNVQKATWSPQGKSTVLEFPDGSNIYYDFTERRQYSLPTEAIDFSFSTSGAKLGYKFITENPEENWLIVSKPTGEGTVAIEHIGSANPADVLIKWSPDNTKVGFYRSSSEVDTEEILLIGEHQENFKSLQVEGRGFEGLWSPQGTKLLYNIYSPQTGYRPELWTTKARENDLGVNKKNLGIRTWVEKCVFSSDDITVFCAVPLYLPQGTGIYPALSQKTPDSIYKINLQTGFKQQIAIPTNVLGVGLYTAQKLMLSLDEKILHMVDAEGGIYEIRLE